MIKQLLLAAAISLTACAGSPKPAPITPPPTTVVVAQPTLKVVEPPAAVELSTTLTTYKGSTWSVGFPSNMTVEKQSDEAVKVSTTDNTAMAFSRQTGDTSSLEEFTDGLVMAFLARGHQALGMKEIEMAGFPARVVLYQGSKGIVCFVLTATGSNTYGFVYMGPDNPARLAVFQASVASIKITDKHVKATVKPAVKK